MSVVATNSLRAAATARPLTAPAAIAALMAVALVSGCIRPGPVSDPTPPISTAAPHPSVAPSTWSGSPLRPPSGLPTARPSGPSTPVFVEQTAIACGSYVTGQQVIALLRTTAGVLPSGANATVHTGPLCSGTWQYTVIQVPNRDPLRVVTSGSASSLKLVTAGTDVCTVDVRAVAPAGIRSAAEC